MNKKLLLAAVILALGGLVYFVYPAAKNFFLKGATKKIINNNSTQNSEEAENNEKQNSDSENNGQETVAPKVEFAPKDCDNNCSRFKKDSEKEYCQEICGTKTFFEDAEEEGGSSGDCASEKGVQKDYCLKDIAVGNKDYKTCNEIKDANIKKSCQNRITEDILESQPSQMPNDL
ncbi:MAG TPA: hypothetical protein P5262_01645 [Candidatus Moranbacteria bacterium]|nr:hypothetical protein [Candidatus Moranbacteria bacterium]